MGKKRPGDAQLTTHTLIVTNSHSYSWVKESAHLNHPCLDAALLAAESAGAILASRFATHLNIEEKGESNFVTEVDVAAEKAIEQILKTHHPDHSLLGEESNRLEVAHDPNLWIVDPLDGTSNFLHGIPQVAVSIAYYQEGKGQVGVVLNPIRNDLYVAVAGQGAWHNGVRQHVGEAKSLSQVMVACGFYYDRGAMMRATLDTIAAFFEQKIHGIRRFGAAALDLCNVGCGQFGAFFEYQLHPWDYAAGQLFVQEAGGITTDAAGNQLPLGGPSSICCSNQWLHEPSLKVIAPHFAKLQS